jgi:hypothetical protein
MERGAMGLNKLVEIATAVLRRLGQADLLDRVADIARRPLTSRRRTRGTKDNAGLIRRRSRLWWRADLEQPWSFCRLDTV